MQGIKHQETQLNVVWEPLPGSQTLAMSCPCNHILFDGSRGPGKALALDTPVMTDSGWKKAGDITYTDKLLAPDGTYTSIMGIYPQGVVDLYDVTFYSGQVIRACGNHRWSVWCGKKGSRQGWITRDTNWLRERIRKGRYYTPMMSAPAPGKTWDGLDPYIAGLLLGDGTLSSDRVCLYSADAETRQYLEAQGWIYREYVNDHGRTLGRLWPQNAVMRQWQEFLGKHKREHKRVPQELLDADPDTRLALLQGLMDSDGTIEERGRMEFINTSEHLAKAVQYLVRSLGGESIYHWRVRTDGVPHQNGLGGRFRVGVNLPQGVVPFRLTRKANRVKTRTKYTRRAIDSIEHAGRGEAVCFAVDHPSHEFVIDGFVVTHNTDAQLMYFRQYVGQGYGAYWRGVIFDREYKNLDDLVAKSKRWFHAFNDGARWLASGKDYKWVWPTGEELLFRAIKDPDDYWNFHGQEFPYIGWNELTKFPNHELYESMMSCNRSSFLPHRHAPLNARTGLREQVPEIPLVVFSTTNPFGVGHNWVKHRFIDPAPPGVPVRMSSEVFNPRKQQREVITKTQVRLFGSYKENTYLSPEYVLELENITDENKRRAWLYGDWDVVAGGALDDVWGEHNIVEDFNVPAEWYIDRAFDWGSSDPFSVGWWAVANGEEVTLPSGKVFCPPAGSLVRIAEWYGSERPGSNKGMKMSAGDIAKGIKQRETEMIARGILPYKPNIGPGDNQIFDVPQSDVESIADKMGDHGIFWERSNKSPGSRINGLALLRERLENAERKEGPGIYVMRKCQASLMLLPTLPRDTKKPDDVDTEAEDHVYDEWRYRVLAGTDRTATDIEVHFPT